MKEQVWQQLVEYLQKVEDFASEQLPELILQVLRYEKIMAITTTVVATLVLILFAFISYTYWKDPKRDQYGMRSGESCIGIALPIFLSVIFWGLLCTSVTALIKLYVAPKYYLLQLFMNMK